MSLCIEVNVVVARRRYPDVKAEMQYEAIYPDGAIPFVLLGELLKSHLPRCLTTVFSLRWTESKPRGVTRKQNQGASSVFP